MTSSPGFTVHIDQNPYLPHRLVAPGESRDHHVGIRVNAGEPGQLMLAARVGLVPAPRSPGGQRGHGPVAGQGGGRRG